MRRLHLWLCLFLAISALGLAGGCGWLERSPEGESYMLRAARQFLEREYRPTGILKSENPEDWARLWQEEIGQVSTPAFKSIHRTIPKVSQAPSRSACLEQAALYREEGLLKMQPAPPVPVAFDWREKPVDSRTWIVNYHALQPVYCLAVQYEATGDRRALEEALAIFRGWDEHDAPDQPDVDSLAWHDHGTARRLMIITYLWQTLAQDNFPLKAVDARQLARAADFHMQLLQQSKFFNEGHNHGYFQSLAVFLAASAFDFLEKAPEARRFGYTHMLDYMDNSFTAEGVHKEHSLSYHRSLSRHLQTALSLLDSLGMRQVIPPRLLHIKDESDAFLRQGTTATGNIAPVGDTGSNGGRYPVHPKGNNTQPAPTIKLPLNVVYEESGYASFRNTWDFNGGMVHLFFTNAFFGKAHKHDDNLGFHLSGFGRDWLIDSAFKGYNRDAHYTYARSPFAHNIIVIDEKDFNLEQAKKLPQPVLTRQLSGQGRVGVFGLHRLYSGWTHQRRILYDRDKAFVLEDRLTPDTPSTETHTFDLLFQAPADLALQQEGSRIILRDPGSSWELVLQVMQDRTQATPEIIRGQTQPYFLGWRYVSGKAQPASTIRFRIKGEQFPRTVTTLHFRKKGSQAPNPLLSGPGP